MNKHKPVPNQRLSPRVTLDGAAGVVRKVFKNKSEFRRERRNRRHLAAQGCPFVPPIVLIDDAQETIYTRYCGAKPIAWTAELERRVDDWMQLLHTRYHMSWNPGPLKLPYKLGLEDVSLLEGQLYILNWSSSRWSILPTVTQSGAIQDPLVVAECKQYYDEQVEAAKAPDIVPGVYLNQPKQINPPSGNTSLTPSGVPMVPSFSPVQWLAADGTALTSKQMIARGAQRLQGGMHSKGVWLLPGRKVVEKRYGTGAARFNRMQMELKILTRLRNCDFVPKVIAFDPKERIVWMTYCGADAKESLQKRATVHRLLTILRDKYGVYRRENVGKRFQTLIKNVTQDGDKTYIIDFGSNNWAIK